MLYPSCYPAHQWSTTAPAYDALPPTYAQNDVPSRAGASFPDDKQEPAYGQQQPIGQPAGPVASGSSGGDDLSEFGGAASLLTLL